MHQGCAFHKEAQGWPELYADLHTKTGRNAKSHAKRRLAVRRSAHHNWKEGKIARKEEATCTKAVHSIKKPRVCQGRALFKNRVTTCTKAVHSIKKPRVGQNRMYTLYMTVYLVISLPKVPCIHRICMVLAKPLNPATKKGG